MTNTNLGNRESDHDYGFSPRQNGCPSRKSKINSSTDCLGTFQIPETGKTKNLGKMILFLNSCITTGSTT